MKIYVTYEEVCLDSEYSSELYGPWRQDFSFSILGARASIPDLKPSWYASYETIEISGTVEPGDIVYVLSIDYNTGDSFGTAQGRGEVIWVFTDQTTAYNAQKSFYKNQDKFTIEITEESGKVIKLSNPAAGYFESINNIEITECLVEE